MTADQGGGLTQQCSHNGLEGGKPESMETM